MNQWETLWLEPLPRIPGLFVTDTEFWRCLPYLIGQIHLGDFSKSPIYAMFSITSYFHIHLSWLSIRIENIMWGPAKKVSIFLSWNTKFSLESNFSRLSALCFLVKNMPFYTCTLENSCFNFFAYIAREKSNIQFICSLSKDFRGWNEVTTVVLLILKLCHSVDYHRIDKIE